MDGTTLEYNDIKFLNVFTKSMSHEVVRDSVDRDVIGIKIRIDIDGCIQNDKDNKFIQPGSETGSEMLEAIRVKLMTPRQTLVYTTGPGQQVLRVAGMRHFKPMNGGANQFDIDNGPRPISLTVNRVVAGRASWYDVSYSIEATVVLAEQENELQGGTSQQAGGSTPLEMIGKTCRGLNPNAQAIVSNKWDTSQTIDDRKYSKIQYDGTLRLMSAAKRPAENLTFLINACLPPVMLGFSRDSVYFSLSKDGRSLNYRITDTERYAAPPQPATTWSGSVSVSTKENGTTCHLGCNISMNGGPGTHPYQLLTRAMRIAELKLGRFEGLNTDFILKTLGFTENLHDNSIILNVQAERTGKDGSTPADIFRTYYNNVGQTLDKQQKLGNRSAGSLQGYNPKVHPIGPVLMKGDYPQDQGYPIFADCFRNAISGLNSSVPVLSFEGASRSEAFNYNAGKREETKIQETTQPQQGSQNYSDGYLNPKDDASGNVAITMSKVKTHYENKSGMIALPRAVSAARYNTRPVQFVKICQASTEKVITVDCASFSTWPNVPTPVDVIKMVNTGSDADINIYLIDSNVELHGPQKKGNALEFRIKATYRFATDKTINALTAQPDAYVSISDPTVEVDPRHRIVPVSPTASALPGPRGGGGGGGY